MTHYIIMNQLNNCLHLKLLAIEQNSALQILMTTINIDNNNQIKKTLNCREHGGLIVEHQTE